MHHIELGKKEGTEIAYGGKRFQNGELKKGFYVSPTVFTEEYTQLKQVTINLSEAPLGWYP